VIARLHSGTSVVATVTLETHRPSGEQAKAPPIIIRQLRVFRQTSRKVGVPRWEDDEWRYDEVEAYWVP
jgi:hypothetical protein